MNFFKIILVSVLVFALGCKKTDGPAGSPAVSSTSPAGNATDVSRNSEIYFTFNQPMDSQTVTSSTFVVRQGATKINGTVTYEGATAKFVPSEPLNPATVYTATMTTAVKNKAGIGLTADAVWNFTTAGSLTVLKAIDLGTAANYVILAKTAVNNSATSAITGDIGISPAATSYITGLSITNATGFATSSQVTGKIYAADMAVPTPANMTTAVSNMITAYNAAAGRRSPDFSELGGGNIGGKTLSAGLYKWTNTVTMPTNVTIAGNANDVWIFQISGDLLMSSAVKILLSGGAQAKNIFWQVAGQATLGTTSHFEGTLLSMTGITLKTGASFNGRALAQTAVILDSNEVIYP